MSSHLYQHTETIGHRDTQIYYPVNVSYLHAINPLLPSSPPVLYLPSLNLWFLCDTPKTYCIPYTNTLYIATYIYLIPDIRVLLPRKHQILVLFGQINNIARKDDRPPSQYSLYETVFPNKKKNVKETED